MNEQDYTSISPYTDQEAVEALKRVARNPFLPVVSKFFFPDEPFNTFRKLLKEIHSIDDILCQFYTIIYINIFWTFILSIHISESEVSIWNY